MHVHANRTGGSGGGDSAGGSRVLRWFRGHPVRNALVLVVLALVSLLVWLNATPGEKHIEVQLERLYATHDPQFRRSLGVLLGPPVVPGNRYEALINGDRIFPAMLSAIGSARRSITFETYIYWSGEIGARFAQALAERARAGVRVHVLLDWVGSAKMDDALIDAMTAAGVEVRRYHKPHPGSLSKLNNRTHRKLLVVDGRVGFTGGVGIAPEWTGDAQDPQHWRDSHFRVEGPVVAQMQAVFMDNWTKATGKVLHGADYFPALAPVGDGDAQVFSSSPSGGSESMHLMYLMAITAAARTIDLQNAYFVPDKLAIDALLAALRRGVAVRILVPGEFIDSQVVRRASRAGWGPLLEAGAQIWEYQPTMFHCKVMVVDGLMVSVGSTNFDNRSFRLNDEANLNIFDEAFAAEQRRIFDADLARSRRVTLQQWQSRPWQEKVLERFAALLSAQL